MTPAEIARETCETCKKLTAERDFLLLRCSNAGKVSFHNERWTGVSSNALVDVAFFGREDNSLPWDGQDLAACYRTVMRLPEHLKTDAVFAQLKRGEDNVSSDNLKWAREVTGWPTDQEQNQ